MPKTFEEGYFKIRILTRNEFERGTIFSTGEKPNPRCYGVAKCMVVASDQATCNPGDTRELVLRLDREPGASQWKLLQSLKLLDFLYLHATLEQTKTGRYYTSYRLSTEPIIDRPGSEAWLYKQLYLGRQSLQQLDPQIIADVIDDLDRQSEKSSDEVDRSSQAGETAEEFLAQILERLWNRLESAEQAKLNFWKSSLLW